MKLPKNFEKIAILRIGELVSFLGVKIQFSKKTMKGLDTVESLSAEASANLSANRTHLISITVKWYQSDCWADVGLIQGFLCANLGKIFLLL
jgi:hypothetical protein